MSNADHPDPTGHAEHADGADRAAGANAGSEDIDRLAASLEDELRTIAHRLMTGERREHTLQTTALVNEAWLKLSTSNRPPTDRATFLGSAARAMRQILVDHARTRGRLKRGGGARRQALDDLVLACEARSGDLLALDAALCELGARDRLKVQLIELRFFGGFEMEEAAAALGLTRRTAERHWTMARAWLRTHLAPDTGRGTADSAADGPA